MDRCSTWLVNVHSTWLVDVCSMWFIDGGGGHLLPFIDRCWTLIAGGGSCRCRSQFVDSGAGPLLL